MKIYFDWSQARDAEAAQLYRDSHSAADIANLFNRQYRAGLSRSAVAGRLKRLGVKAGGDKRRGAGRKPKQMVVAMAAGRDGRGGPANWSDAALQTLREAWAGGATTQAIADAFDGKLDGGRRLSRKILEKLRHRHKWPARATGARPRAAGRKIGRAKVPAAQLPDYGVRAGPRVNPVESLSCAAPLALRLRRTPRDPAEARFTPQVDPGRGVSIMALETAMCRLILGYAGEHAVYCGCGTDAVERGGFRGFESYCPGHLSALAAPSRLGAPFVPRRGGTGFDFRPHGRRAA